MAQHAALRSQHYERQKYLLVLAMTTSYLRLILDQTKSHGLCEALDYCNLVITDMFGLKPIVKLMQFLINTDSLYLRPR